MREHKYKFVCGIKGQVETYIGLIFTLDEVLKDLLRNAMNIDWSIISKHQFIGNRDKNGKDIYEGDIIRGNHIELSCPIEGIVEYDNKYARHGIKFNLGGSGYVGICQMVSIEIIGDIYKNINNKKIKR